MITVKKQMELEKKILRGLDKAYKNLIEFKKLKKSNLVIMQGDKIVSISAEEAARLNRKKM